MKMIWKLQWWFYVEERILRKTKKSEVVTPVHSILGWEMKGRIAAEIGWCDGCAGCCWRIGSAVWILYSLLGVESVAEVVRRVRLRWFGHVERKNRDDWVLACRNVVVAGVRCAGRGRKTWRECVKDDMDELGLHSQWVVFRDICEEASYRGKNVWPWKKWAWKKWTYVIILVISYKLWVINRLNTFVLCKY